MHDGGQDLNPSSEAYNTPVKYPRSGEDRDIGLMNKGGASQSDSIDNSVALNNTGNVNVPRHADTPIDYLSDGDSDLDDAGMDDTTKD